MKRDSAAYKREYRKLEKCLCEVTDAGLKKSLKDLGLRVVGGYNPKSIEAMTFVYAALGAERSRRRAEKVA